MRFNPAQFKLTINGPNLFRQVSERFRNDYPRQIPQERRELSC